MDVLAALLLIAPPVTPDPPPVADPPPVKAGTWLVKKSRWDERVVDAVEAGREVWVSVGEDYPDAVRLDECEPGLGKGVFKFWKKDGKRQMSQLVRPSTTPASTPAYQYQPVIPSFGLFRPASGST